MAFWDQLTSKLDYAAAQAAATLKDCEIIIRSRKQNFKENSLDLWHEASNYMTTTFGGNKKPDSGMKPEDSKKPGALNTPDSGAKQLEPDSGANQLDLDSGENQLEKFVKTRDGTVTEDSDF